MGGRPIFSSTCKSLSLRLRMTRAMDGRIVRCGIISSCQSAATSEIAKRFWSRTHVRSATASTRPLLRWHLRSTQPPTLSGRKMSSSLRASECLMWLIGAVVCLLAANRRRVQLFADLCKKRYNKCSYSYCYSKCGNGTDTSSHRTYI